MGEQGYFRHCESIRLDLLDLYGRGYVFDHCIAAYEQEIKERRYRTYVTDALMAMAGNTARFSGGSVMGIRWADDGKPTDTRTGDEIAADFITRTGLTYAPPKGDENDGFIQP